MAQNNDSPRARLDRDHLAARDRARGRFSGRTRDGQSRRRRRRGGRRRGREGERQGPGRHQDAGEDLSSPRASFPTGWTKEADLASVTGVSFDGADAGAEGHRRCRRSTSATASAAAAWGRSPAASRRTRTARAARTWRRLAIDMAKQGKGLGEILAAIDDKQKPSGGSPPSGGAAARGRFEEDRPVRARSAARRQGDQGHDRRVQRLPVPVLQALRADGQGGRSTSTARTWRWSG